jgi:hypothetical protein
MSHKEHGSNLKGEKLMFTYIKRKGQIRRFYLRTEMSADYAIVANAENQNQLREALAILDRYNMMPDVTVGHWDGKYRLLAYTRNNKGRAAFLAGIIYAHKTLKKRQRHGLVRL